MGPYSYTQSLNVWSVAAYNPEWVSALACAVLSLSVFCQLIIIWLCIRIWNMAPPLLVFVYYIQTVGMSL